MDKNVTKEGLLKLKDSKPVPITAHSHEIIIPCVYTEKVQRFLDKEGIKLPLSHHKLAELKKIAKHTKGTLKEEDNKDEGDSHATGTINLKSSKKTTSAKAQNINKITIINAPQTKRRKRKSKRRVGLVSGLATMPDNAKLGTTSGLTNIPDKHSLLPLIRNPPSNRLRIDSGGGGGNPNYAMIRPITYSASNPVTDTAKSIEEGFKRQREAIAKREEELKQDEAKYKGRIEALEKNTEAERRRQDALISSMLNMRMPTPQPVTFNVTPQGNVTTTPSTPHRPPSPAKTPPKMESESDNEEEKEKEKHISSDDEEDVGQPVAAASSASSSSTPSNYGVFSKKFLMDFWRLIPTDERPVIVGIVTQEKLVDAIDDYNPAILQYAKEEYNKMSVAGTSKKTWYKNKLLDAVKKRYFND